MESNNHLPHSTVAHPGNFQLLRQLSALTGRQLVPLLVGLKGAIAEQLTNGPLRFRLNTGKSGFSLRRIECGIGQEFLLLHRRDLLQFVKGPDFPTGGIVFGRSGIKDAFECGRGKFTIRARAAVQVHLRQLITYLEPLERDRPELFNPERGTP